MLALLAALLALVGGAAFAAVAWLTAARLPALRDEAAFLALLGAALVLLGFGGALALPALAQAALAPVGFALAPLMRVTARRLGAARPLPDVAGAVFALVALIGLASLYTDGFTRGPGEWAAPVAVMQSMLVGFVALPSLVASSLLVLAALRSRGLGARRVRLFSLCATVFFTAFTMDALGANALAAPVLRAAMLGAPLLAYLAFFPFEAAARLRVRFDTRFEPLGADA